MSSVTVSLEVPARQVALPRTGASVEVLLAVALVLLIVGVLAMKVGAR
jgi:hypothetical protein